MWTVVYMAQNRDKAGILQSVLEQAGILVRVQPVGKMENTNDYLEVSVPETEVEQAHSIIIDKGF